MRFSCISELDITNAIKDRYGAYMENDIKSVVLINDEEEDFIIRIVSEEDTVYGPETTTIEEYLNGPESHTIAFKDCQFLIDCAEVLLNSIPLLQNQFEIIYINEEDV